MLYIRSPELAKALAAVVRPRLLGIHDVTLTKSGFKMRAQLTLLRTINKSITGGSCIKRA